MKIATEIVFIIRHLFLSSTLGCQRRASVGFVESVLGSSAHHLLFYLSCQQLFLQIFMLDSECMNVEFSFLSVDAKHPCRVRLVGVNGDMYTYSFELVARA